MPPSAPSPSGVPSAPAASVGPRSLRSVAPIPPPPERGVASWLPGLWVIRHYRRSWIGSDVVAGLVLSALLVPAGMGYAEAAGLPPITGLYATIAPLLAYALAGPSRILVIGPDSALVALIATTVLPMAAGDPGRATALAAMLALLTGALCVGAGLAKLGFLTDLLSKPVRVGYMNGLALTVIVSQAPKLCGFSASGDGLLPGIAGLARGLLDGRARPAAIAIGAACLVLIFGFKAMAPRVPGVLLAVVIATVAVHVLDLEARIPVVGVVPRGLPLPSFPAVRLADIGPLFTAAVGVALVSFADTSVISRTFAARSGQRVDPSRELVGLGITNVASGLMLGFPVSSSSSRTPVAEAAGSRTQLTGVVGAIVIAALLIAAPDLVRDMPLTALAAVVIAAVWSLFDLKSLRVFARVRRSDFFVSVFCFLAVAALGVIPGIALAVALSLLDFVRRAWHPHDAILGRAPGVKGYHDVTRYPEAKQVPGLVLYRWDAPLFFANADTFRERILEIVDAAEAPVKWVVIAAEPITDVDTTAADMIQELDKELAVRGTELAFAELKDPVKDRLHRYGLKATIGRDFFFPTIGVAVKEFLDRNNVTWIDWEEARPESQGPVSLG